MLVSRALARDPESLEKIPHQGPAKAKKVTVVHLVLWYIEGGCSSLTPLALNLISS